MHRGHASPRKSGERDLSWNKVQPRHAGCQVSNLCVAGKGIAGSPGTNHCAAPGVLPCPLPMLPVSRQSPHPPGTQAAALPPAPSPGRARSAWATCEEPKDRGRPSPAPTGVSMRCSQRAWPLQGKEKPEPAPALAFKGSCTSAMFYTSSSLLLSKRVYNHRPGRDQCCSLL